MRVTDTVHFDMAEPTAIRVPKTRFYHPQRNLPGRSSGQTAEGRFTNAFIRGYVAQARNIHAGSTKHNLAFAREVPVNGYGIADAVTVAWDTHATKGEPVSTAPDFFLRTSPTIRAFEVKLKDWRAGMLQAHRYRFYSHVGILVLPARQMAAAEQYLHTFKAIRVGLWGFNAETNTIQPVYTPRPAKPRDMRYVYEALRGVQQASRALPFA